MKIKKLFPKDARLRVSFVTMILYILETVFLGIVYPYPTLDDTGQLTVRFVLLLSVLMDVLFLVCLKKIEANYESPADFFCMLYGGFIAVVSAFAIIFIMNSISSLLFLVPLTSFISYYIYRPKKND